MKQKNNSSGVVTKKVLKEELGALEERMDKKFVTTKDYFHTELNNTIHRLLQGIRNEIRFSAEVVIDKLEKRMQEVNDRNFTKLDSISKELEEMREDKIIGGHQVEEKLDDYGKRIAKLEQIQQPA